MPISLSLPELDDSADTTSLHPDALPGLGDGLIQARYCDVSLLGWVRLVRHQSKAHLLQPEQDVIDFPVEGHVLGHRQVVEEVQLQTQLLNVPRQH